MRSMFSESSSMNYWVNTSQTPIGKVDEVLGPINQVYFTIKPQEGIVATSFKPGDKVYIGGDKLLPLEKYVVSQLLRALLTRHLDSFPSPRRLQVGRFDNHLKTLLIQSRFQTEEARWCWQARYARW